MAQAKTFSTPTSTVSSKTVSRWVIPRGLAGWQGWIPSSDCFIFCLKALLNPMWPGIKKCRAARQSGGQTLKMSNRCCWTGVVSRLNRMRWAWREQIRSNQTVSVLLYISLALQPSLRESHGNMSRSHFTPKYKRRKENQTYLISFAFWYFYDN